jgi:hypothetical protein
VPLGGLAETRAPVSTYIVKRLDCALLSPSDDHTLPGHVSKEVIARIRDLFEFTRAYPHAEEEPLQLGPVVLLVRVIKGGEAECVGR